MAERKARENTNAMQSLQAELRREKLLNISAMNTAKRITKENTDIKRAIQSIGCKIHISSSGDCIVDIENNPAGAHPNLYCSSRQGSSSAVINDKKDLYVSVTEDDGDDGNNVIGRICDSLCPFRTKDGGCRWPNGGCAQLGSQFVGLKANFDAFDQLSIDDSYFKPK